jgi:hypothetical protein
LIVIERFEGDVAVLEEVELCQYIDVDRCLLPINAREGDVVELQSGSYIVNRTATAARRREVVARLRKMGL